MMCIQFEDARPSALYARCHHTLNVPSLQKGLSGHPPPVCPVALTTCKAVRRESHA